MSYRSQYRNGKSVQVGDLISHNSWTAEVRQGREVKTLPLVGEVVAPIEFFKCPSSKQVCVVFHYPSMYGFHTFKTTHLPRENGGCAFLDPKDVKFLRRATPGQSVFDPKPTEKKRYYDEE